MNTDHPATKGPRTVSLADEDSQPPLANPRARTRIAPWRM